MKIRVTVDLSLNAVSDDLDWSDIVANLDYNFSYLVDEGVEVIYHTEIIDAEQV